MVLDNVKIIGTSHIAPQSLKEVKRAIIETKPHILALELDRGRLNALMSNKRGRRVPISEIGLKGYIFYLLGSYLQRKIGDKIGIMPGAEMKLAIKMAKKHRIKVALIDRDIRVTLRRLSQAIGWREKLNFIVDLIRGVLFGRQELERLGLSTIDLTKVPEEDIIERLIKRVRERYPGAYLALIEERNQIMANRIIDLALRDPDKRILVIVGAGHKQGIEEAIERATSTELAVAG